MSLEMHYFSATLLLGFVYLLLATLAFLGQNGLAYAASPRDEPRPVVGKAGRMERAARNFMETFPLFLGAMLLAQMTGIHNAKTLLGNELYFWARCIYIPVYVFGIPYLRTGVWAVSVVGILVIMCGCCHYV
jgi:uncharacterized MAPEG superfamily protein